MSKRSSRRLAVVAGAALALGSMAPALAVRVDGNATGTVSVDPDLSDIAVPTLPDVEAILADVDGIRTDVEALANARVAALTGAVQADADAILGTLEGLGGLLGNASGLVGIGAVVDPAGAVKVDADADARGVLGLASGAVEDTLANPTAAVDAVLGLETVGEAQATVGMVAGIATGAVSGVDVDDLPGTVLGLVDVGGLLNGGLEDILGVSGDVSVNVLANLLASF